MVLLLPIQLPQQGLLLFAASFVSASILIITKNKSQKDSQHSKSSSKLINNNNNNSSYVHKGYLNNTNLVFSYQVRDHTHDEFQNDILAVIHEIIPFASKLTIDEIEITPLIGSVSTNLIYLVHLLPLKLKVVIHLFGREVSDIFDRNQENVILASLSSSKSQSTTSNASSSVKTTGPIFYGLFSNGRIEGYLPYTALTPQDTMKPHLIPAIAHGISELHCLSLNSISTDVCGWRMMESFLESAQDIIAKASSKCISKSSNDNSSNSDTNLQQFNESFFNQDALLIHHTYINQMIQEYEWLKTKLTSYVDRAATYQTNISSRAVSQNLNSVKTADANATAATANISCDRTEPTFIAADDDKNLPITARTNGDNDNEINGSSSNGNSSSTAGSNSTSSNDEWNGFVFGLDKVLCHNDLMAGNMLLVTANGGDCDDGNLKSAATATDRVILQNFEYAGYSIRAWDIANHFCECAGFEANYQKDFPPLPLRVLFYSEYIQSYVRHLLNNANASSNTVDSPASDTTTAGTTIPADLLYINELLERDGARLETIFLELANSTSHKSQQHSLAVSSIQQSKKSQKSKTIEQELLHQQEVQDELIVLQNIESKLSTLLTAAEEKHLIQFLSGFDEIVCKFTLISHLLWGSRAIVQAAASSPSIMKDFDFAGYSQRRYKGYFLHKQMFFPNEAVHSSHKTTSPSHHNSPQKAKRVDDSQH